MPWFVEIKQPSYEFTHMLSGMSSGDGWQDSEVCVFLWLALWLDLNQYGV